MFVFFFKVMYIFISHIFNFRVHSLKISGVLVSVLFFFLFSAYAQTFEPYTDNIIYFPARYYYTVVRIERYIKKINNDWSSYVMCSRYRRWLRTGNGRSARSGRPGRSPGSARG